MIDFGHLSVVSPLPRERERKRKRERERERERKRERKIFTIQFTLKKKLV